MELLQPGFCYGGKLELKVKVFCSKNFSFKRRLSKLEQLRAPSRWTIFCDFLENMTILTPFREEFLDPFKRQKLEVICTN